MRIKFNRDFRGRETDEVFYAQGDVADISDAFALVLVADGVAERAKPSKTLPEVIVAEPEPTPEVEAVEPEPVVEKVQSASRPEPEEPKKARR